MEYHVGLRILLVLLTFAATTSLELHDSTNRTLVDTDLNTTIDYEYESLLALRWRLQQSSVSYSGLRFDINFVASDYITENLVQYIIYDGIECSYGANDVTEDGYFDSSVSTEVAYQGAGFSSQEITFSAEIRPETISDSSAYEEIGNDASINFCVRVALYNKDLSDESAVEITALDAIVNLDVDLSDNLSISGQDVKPRDVGKETSDDAFFVDAFICEEDNSPPGDVKPYLQGQAIRVCVQPTQQALDIGFRMRRIDRFTFLQGFVSQEAVVNRQPSINGLTELSCQEGDHICVFETILMAGFYQGEAAYVGGSGEATLQFGSGEFRSLRSRERRLETSKSIALELFGVETFNSRDFMASGNSKLSISFIIFTTVICSGIYAIWVS